LELHFKEIKLPSLQLGGIKLVIEVRLHFVDWWLMKWLMNTRVKLF